MGWCKQIFGVENPSKKTRIVVYSIFAVLAFMLYSFWIDFQPVDWLAHDTWFVAAAAGVACTVWIEWAAVTRRITPRRMSRTFFVLLSPLFVLLITAVIWVFIAHGIAGAVTRLFGTEVVQSPVVMYTKDRYHRRECRPQLLGASMHGFAQDHLCISVAYYTAHPDHQVEVQLVGRQSPLGFFITGFRHLRDLGPYTRP